MKPQTQEEILNKTRTKYNASLSDDEMMRILVRNYDEPIIEPQECYKAMCEYARQAIKYALESDQQRFSKDVAEKLLLIRDALVARDDDEAYHQLLLIVDPDLGYDHWSEVEKMAKSSILSRYESIIKELGL